MVALETGSKYRGSEGHCSTKAAYLASLFPDIRIVCGHTVEKVTRCSLPFYWFDGRRPPVIDWEPPEPFFDCYNCIDEKEQVYRIGCPECTGRGDVHGASDLVREGRVVDGRNKDPLAYERVLKNHHAYLISYIYFIACHTTLMYSLAPAVLRHVIGFGIGIQDAWKAVLDDGGMDLWMQNPMVAYSVDKIFAEQKCRQDKDHPLPDSTGHWQAKENHMSEHRPYLNNVSTAIKRALADSMLQDFEQILGLRFWPILCEGDTIDERIEAFQAQTLGPQVEIYWDHRRLVENPDPPLRAPPRGPGRQMPWETLEYVPPQQARGATVRDRYQVLTTRLDYMTSQCEARIPKDDERILGGRDHERQARNDRFSKRTVHLIYELLAADPGLSDTRIKDIARYFDSVCLGPWFKHLGNPVLGQKPEDYPADWDMDNERFQTQLRHLDDIAKGGNLEINGFWEQFAYEKVLPDQNRRNARPEQVMEAALDRWRDFYRTYMHIISSVQASHARVSQEELDNEMSNGRLSDVCGICLETWNVEGPSNYPARIPCGNNHVLCLACFTRHSLEPDAPYNRLNADGGEKKCPLCRGIIQYQKPVSHLEDALGLLSDSTVRYMHGAVFGD